MSGGPRQRKKDSESKTAIVAEGSFSREGNSGEGGGGGLDARDASLGSTQEAGFPRMGAEEEERMQPLNLSDNWRLICAFPAHANGAPIKTLSLLEEVTRNSRCRVLVSAGHDAELGIRLWSMAGECLGEFVQDSGILPKTRTLSTNWTREKLQAASADAVLKEAMGMFFKSPLYTYIVTFFGKHTRALTFDNVCKVTFGRG